MSYSLQIGKVFLDIASKAQRLSYLANNTFVLRGPYSAIAQTATNIEFDPTKKISDHVTTALQYLNGAYTQVSNKASSFTRKDWCVIAASAVISFGYVKALDVLKPTLSLFVLSQHVAGAALLVLGFKGSDVEIETIKNAICCSLPMPRYIQEALQTPESRRLLTISTGALLFAGATLSTKFSTYTQVAFYTVHYTATAIYVAVAAATAVGIFVSFFPKFFSESDLFNFQLPNSEALWKKFYHFSFTQHPREVFLSSVALTMLSMKSTYVAYSTFGKGISQLLTLGLLSQPVCSLVSPFSTRFTKPLCPLFIGANVLNSVSARDAFLSLSALVMSTVFIAGSILLTKYSFRKLILRQTAEDLLLMQACHVRNTSASHSELVEGGVFSEQNFAEKTDEILEQMSHLNQDELYENCEKIYASPYGERVTSFVECVKRDLEENPTKEKSNDSLTSIPPVNTTTFIRDLRNQLNGSKETFSKKYQSTLARETNLHSLANTSSFHQSKVVVITLFDTIAEAFERLENHYHLKSKAFTVLKTGVLIYGVVSLSKIAIQHFNRLK